MHKLIEEIEAGVNVRANLIELKELLKKAVKSEGVTARDYLLNVASGDLSFLERTIKHDDPKVRKNSVQIIGLTNDNSFADILYEAYQAEETLYVRPEYIKVLSTMNVDRYLDALDNQAKALAARDLREDEKHVAAELRELYALLYSKGRGGKHRFSSDEISTMILTTLPGTERYLQAAIDEVIGVDKTTLVRSGVKVESSQYEDLSRIRCYNDLLFVPSGMRALVGHASDMAKKCVDSDLVGYISERLVGSGPFRFYVSVKGRLSVESKSKLAKAFAGELEKLSNCAMINSPNDYEINLQLVGSSKHEGQYALYVIFGGLGNGRFDYKVKSLPTSIKPYVAATICEIIDEKTHEFKRVLDPFCGIGTMLIERNFKDKQEVLTGVDIFGEAVWAASEIRDKLKMDIQYVDKDMKDFEAEEPYNLILTDLPYVTKAFDESKVRGVYNSFLDKAHEWLSDDGIIAAYTMSPKAFSDVIKTHKDIKIIEEVDIYKNKSKLYILSI